MPCWLKFRAVSAQAVLVAPPSAAGPATGAGGGDDPPIRKIMDQVHAPSRAVGMRLRAPAALGAAGREGMAADSASLIRLGKDDRGLTEPAKERKKSQQDRTRAADDLPRAADEFAWVIADPGSDPPRAPRSHREPRGICTNCHGAFREQGGLRPDEAVENRRRSRHRAAVRDRPTHCVVHLGIRRCTMAGRRVIDIRRPELTDEMWEKIGPHLPEPEASPKRGPKPIPNRPIVEGILWVLRNGGRWWALPRGYPSPSTCWGRLSGWGDRGVWQNAWRAFLDELNAEGRIRWEEYLADGPFAPEKEGATPSTRSGGARASGGWWWLRARASLWPATATPRARRR
jgi:transposase